MAATMLPVPTEYVSTASRVNVTPSVDTTASTPATSGRTADGIPRIGLSHRQFWPGQRERGGRRVTATTRAPHSGQRGRRRPV